MKKGKRGKEDCAEGRIKDYKKKQVSINKCLKGRFIVERMPFISTAKKLLKGVASWLR